MSGPRRVFAAFTSDDMLRDSDRLPFAVLSPFVRPGYWVRVYDNLRSRLTAFYQRDWADLPETARITLGVSGVEFSSRSPDDPGDLLRPPARGGPRTRLAAPRASLFRPVAPYRVRVLRVVRHPPEPGAARCLAAFPGRCPTTLNNSRPTAIMIGELDGPQTDGHSPLPAWPRRGRADSIQLEHEVGTHLINPGRIPRIRQRASSR